MKLSALAANGVGELHGEDIEFCSISTDTRTLKAGELFIALRGDNFDAHDKLDDAINMGACALVIDKDRKLEVPALLVDDTTKALGQIGKLYRASFTGTVVGLTGSSGKTSVKGMLKSIFDVKRTCSATAGNFNNHIGVPLTLINIKPENEFAIVEAGTSGKGEIAYLADLIQPNISLVINVHAAHLEGFGGLASIAKEKSAIYLAPSVRIAVVNLDDENSDILYAAATSVNNINEPQRRIIGFSQGKSNSASYVVDDLISVSGVSFDRDGRSLFNLQVNNQVVSIALKIPGDHAVENALAAAAVAYAADISLGQIKQGLESFVGVSGRMELLAGIKGCVLVDDSYNANPGSMMAAVDYLARYEDTYFICGDMAELGEDAQQLHMEVGQHAARNGIKHIFSVGNYSRYLSAECGSAGKHFDSKEELISECKNAINEKSVVVVKGSRSSRMEVVVKALRADGVN